MSRAALPVWMFDTVPGNPRFLILACFYAFGFAT